MTLRWIPAALLALSACSPDPVPPPAPAPKVAMAPNPPAQPQPPKPAEPMPAPPPPAPAPVPPPPPPQPAPVPAPRRQDVPARFHLPSFTLRTTEPGSPQVSLNGEVLGKTPCLWTIADTIEFDRDIPVRVWPPEGAKLLGTTESKEPGMIGKAELYIADSKAIRASVPGLLETDVVLFVKATFSGDTRMGALRLFVEGHHYIDYTPLVNPEGDDASRFLRTLWFERN